MSSTVAHESALFIYLFIYFYFYLFILPHTNNIITLHVGTLFFAVLCNALYDLVGITAKYFNATFSLPLPSLLRLEKNTKPSPQAMPFGEETAGCSRPFTDSLVRRAR